MCDQVHKTLLAYDGLNRTGQGAPASHGNTENNFENAESIRKIVQAYQMSEYRNEIEGFIDDLLARAKKYTPTPSDGLVQIKD